jgi:hypothetical protein
MHPVGTLDCTLGVANSDVLICMVASGLSAQLAVKLIVWYPCGSFTLVEQRLADALPPLPVHQHP